MSGDRGGVVNDNGATVVYLLHESPPATSDGDDGALQPSADIARRRSPSTRILPDTLFQLFFHWESTFFLHFRGIKTFFYFLVERTYLDAEKMKSM